MILDSMLSNHAVFLFLLSAFLLVAYGLVRLVHACVRSGRHWLSHHRPAIR